MTDPLPPLPPKSERGETWGWSEYDLRDYATAAIAPWRAKLAEQCGKTLAAQAQRDELRGLLQRWLEADECGGDVSIVEADTRAALSRCST